MVCSPICHGHHRLGCAITSSENCVLDSVTGLLTPASTVAGIVTEPEYNPGMATTTEPVTVSLL